LLVVGQVENLPHDFHSKKWAAKFDLAPAPAARPPAKEIHRTCGSFTADSPIRLRGCPNQSGTTKEVMNA
ncbi:MAG: hypothetical protein ACREBD_13460, partial [Blastocatellia bacterium]